MRQNSIGGVAEEWYQKAGEAMKRTILLLLAAAAVLTAGCSVQTQPETPAVQEQTTGTTAAAAYRQITQETSREMMQADDGHIVIDVRRQEEYDSGHIPGAVLVPNESIGTVQPDALPDLHQVILVYCRSGRRSKEAAQKLADIGYTQVYEFGGILDWTGEIVTESETVTETQAVTETETQAVTETETQAVTETETQAVTETETEVQEMKLCIGEREVPVTWEDNASVEELQQLLPLTVEMRMYGGFEQVGEIGQSISRDDVQMTTAPGDIVLYAGDQIVVFYGSNAWSYTKLGTIALPESELQRLLGSGNVTLKLFSADRLTSD